jgi:predicted methyltransferase
MTTCRRGEKFVILRPDQRIDKGKAMQIPQFRALFAATVLAFAGSVTSGAAATADPALAAAVANSARSPAAVARDSVRHPVEELTFFGIKPTMSVVELWPGGGYWTDILGVYLAPRGTYTIAQPPSGNGDEDKQAERLHARLAAEKDRFGHVNETTLGRGHFDIAPPGSADLVVTFRNLHNWMDGGYADEALAAIFKALKPGGILGMEEHRGRNDQPQDPKAKSGYVRQDYAIALAKKAGFVVVATSEMNANPRDTKDWPDGVWTLPPSLAEGDKDRAKYVAIGEADNFVIKFRKPQ